MVQGILKGVVAKGPALQPDFPVLPRSGLVLNSISDMEFVQRLEQAIMEGGEGARVLHSRTSAESRSHAKLVDQFRRSGPRAVCLKDPFGFRCQMKLLRIQDVEWKGLELLAVFGNRFGRNALRTLSRIYNGAEVHRVDPLDPGGAAEEPGLEIGGRSLTREEFLEILCEDPAFTGRYAVGGAAEAGASLILEMDPDALNGPGLAEESLRDRGIVTRVVRVGIGGSGRGSLFT